jgi:hypothetical protein
MPWMVPARHAAPLSPLPLSASVIFWTIAALTLAFAWPARHNPNRAYGVLTVSLLVVGSLFLALR